MSTGLQTTAKIAELLFQKTASQINEKLSGRGKNSAKKHYSKDKPEDYNPSNISNQFKHSDLEVYASSVMQARKKAVFIELHAGNGFYRSGDNLVFGSTKKLADILLSSKKEYAIYACEIRQEARQNLAIIAQAIPNIYVMPEWQLNFDTFLGNADSDYTFVFDPSHFRDYDDKLIGAFGRATKTGADVFMYIPLKSDWKAYQKYSRIVYDEQSRSLINKIANIIDSEKRKAVVLRHPTLKGGWCGRIETIVIVSEDKSAIENATKSHTSLFEKNNRYKRFREFRKEDVSQKLNF